MCSRDKPPFSFERVNVFKLVGVHINQSLKWDDHVSAICNKAASRYFLKQLKRSSVDPDDLYHFYTTVIRPILEYACPVWHSSLTVEHSNRIEAIQKRAFRIIFGRFVYTVRKARFVGQTVFSKYIK